MNNDEARAILSEQLKAFATRSYSDLVSFIDKPQSIEVSSPSGTKYGIELNVAYDGEPGTNILVMGCIDDGGWRAWIPLTETLIMRPDGQLV